MYEYKSTIITIHTIVPIPSVTINILNNQTVGQSLTLECDIITVRGITSRMVIMWSSDGSGESGLDAISSDGSGESGLNAIGGVNTGLVTNNSMLFTDTYIIPKLSTADENKEYQCEVFIDTESPVIATGSVILNVTGKHIVTAHIHR